MLHSFRLKIGLLSACFSGLLLAGLGLLAVSVLNRMGLERVDHELRALVDEQVRKDQPPDHWRRFDESLGSIYGQEAVKHFVVKTTLAGGGVLYATPTWPPGLPPEGLPLSLAQAPEEIQRRPPPRQDKARPKDDARRRPRDERDGRERPREAWDARRPSPADAPPPRPAAPRVMRVRGPVYATLNTPGGAWRAITMANDEVSFSLAMDLAGLRAEIRRFQQALLVAVPLGLLLLAAGGWLIGHAALRPVKRIARTAESVTAHRLHERIPSEKADVEFKRLIVLINGMLERLERSFQQATRFSADAAHELKTPLAILQAQTERCLQRAPDGSPEQREYAEQLDEVQRLKVILRKLLLLSQADAGQLPLSLARINLADLARAAADDVRMLAPDRKTAVIAPAELVVSADADLLNQAIENLVSNAVKFGEPGGAISIELTARDRQAWLSFTNTGPAIPPQDHDRVFVRFYRADKARNRKIEGSGLGLSLAREIVLAHGGDLVLERSDKTCTRFILSMTLSG